jgi:hypothetical protein
MQARNLAHAQLTREERRRRAWLKLPIFAVVAVGLDLLFAQNERTVYTVLFPLAEFGLCVLYGYFFDQFLALNLETKVKLPVGAVIVLGFIFLILVSLENNVDLLVQDVNHSILPLMLGWTAGEEFAKAKLRGTPVKSTFFGGYVEKVQGG